MAGQGPHGHGDRSLLDRLNALKPTGISLDRDTNLLSSGPLGGAAAAAAATSAADAAPLESAPGSLLPPSAKEDALSARLRNLRNKAETGESRAARPSDEPSSFASSEAGGAVVGKTQSDTQPHGNPTSQDPSRDSFSHAYTSIPPPIQRDAAEMDVFPAVDEAALDELLGELEFDPEQLDDDDEQPIRFSKEDEAKVSALLERLQKTPGLEQDSDPPSREGSKDADDDDSDGEVMSRAVDKILALARDEAELARAAAEREGEEEEDGDVEAEASEVARQVEPPPLPTSPPAVGADADAPEDPFALPTVPSQLVDPAPPEGEGEEADQARQSRDFENDIAVRMAALKGLGAGINTDSFGLPAAPTFRPEDRPVAGLFKTPGYTDEDQKTWCIVCLDDATVRCIGCDNDVYCARCWRDMHRGPSAGYDERGHEWVKFHPR